MSKDAKPTDKQLHRFAKALGLEIAGLRHEMIRQFADGQFAPDDTITATITIAPQAWRTA